MDADPEATRRNSIGKTRDSINQVRARLVTLLCLLSRRAHSSKRPCG
jgi:hypothetical protein